MTARPTHWVVKGSTFRICAVLTATLAGEAVVFKGSAAECECFVWGVK